MANLRRDEHNITSINPFCIFTGTQGLNIQVIFTLLSCREHTIYQQAGRHTPTTDYQYPYHANSPKLLSIAPVVLSLAIRVFFHSRVHSSILQETCQKVCSTHSTLEVS